MTKTITLTRLSSGFANVADRFVIGEHPEPSDERAGDNTNEYELPPGYEVAESMLGEMVVYNAHGKYCPIVEHRSGRPQIVDDFAAGQMPVLRKVAP